MTRTSPGVKRISAILDFMADHPAQAFALTDLVRALKLSRATCHALLTGLVEVGYLYRTSDKTYVLGPALARVGRAAAQNMSPLQIAQPEMRALADDFDVVCSAFFLEGDTIVSRERASSLSHVGYSIPLGTRVKLQPRSLPVFFSWSPAEAQAWLDRVSPPVSAEQAATVAAGMAFVREHGFAALSRSDLVDDNLLKSSTDIAATVGDWPLSVLPEIEPERRYAVSSITAPVFNSADKVEFVLTLMGFSAPMTGEAIFAAAASLIAACKRISGFLA